MKGFELFNICRPSFPTIREVIDCIYAEVGVPRPHFGIARLGAYVFGWLMEKPSPLVPGDPFLTRAIIYLIKDWYAPSILAKLRIGYVPQFDWQEAIRRQLAAMAVRALQRRRWWTRFEKSRFCWSWGNTFDKIVAAHQYMESNCQKEKIVILV